MSILPERIIIMMRGGITVPVRLSAQRRRWGKTTLGLAIAFRVWSASNRRLAGPEDTETE